MSCLFDVISNLVYWSTSCEIGYIGRFFVVILGYGNVVSFGGKFGYGRVTSSLGIILYLSTIYGENANVLFFVVLAEYSSV